MDGVIFNGNKECGITTDWNPEPKVSAYWFGTHRASTNPRGNPNTVIALLRSICPAGFGIPLRVGSGNWMVTQSGFRFQPVNGTQQ